NKGLNISEFKELNTLEGFKPKIIEGVASDSDYSILDILESLELFKTQNISIESLKISLYKLVFMPFFAPFLMLIMYYFFPVIARFFNLAFVAFVAFVVTLLTWGMLFLLSRLSENGVILSELGIVMPIVLLIFLGGFMFYKHR
ncbi:LptF/LptG family permease, partial [Campylobacter coli]|nr:LptF/LptG family permease [Campylobacter coli]